MRTARFTVALLLACAMQADDRISAEIARLEQTLKTAEAGEVPNDVREGFAAYRTALERATKATSREYQLYRLRDAFVGIETLSFLAKHYESHDTLDNVDALWRAYGARFTAKPPKPRGTLLQRALIESATTRADRLYDASLPYAKAAAPWSGLYYLGEAIANLRFREFVQSIAAGSSEKSPSRDRLIEMADAVERDTLTFFGSDVTNQAAVPVSVRLKEARELLDAGRIDGATLLLVEARAALSRRGGPRASHPSTDRTDSIAAMLAAWAADEQPPMSEALREQIVPFHAALFAPASARKQAKPAQVTVTLVRWPYT